MHKNKAPKDHTQTHKQQFLVKGMFTNGNEHLISERMLFVFNNVVVGKRGGGEGGDRSSKICSTGMEILKASMGARHCRAKGSQPQGQRLAKAGPKLTPTCASLESSQQPDIFDVEQARSGHQKHRGSIFQNPIHQAPFNL